MIDESGKVLMKPQPIDFITYSENIIKFKDDEKFGYADKLGNVLLPAQFEKASDYKGKFAWVKIAGKEAIINTNGKFIRKPNSAIKGGGDFLITFNEFFTKLKIQEKGNLWIIPKNKRLNRDEYEIRDFDYVSEELLAFKTKGKWGLINKEGKIILPPDYEGIGYYEDIERWSSETRTKEYLPGLIRVKKEKKYGYITKDGELVYPIIFDSLEQGQMCRRGELDGEFIFFDFYDKCVYPEREKGKSIESFVKDYLKQTEE